MFPAKAENTAPTINAGTINQLVVSTTVEIPNNATEAITTKIESNLYSALQNAKAPSLMFLEISCIRAFPGFCFFTQTIFINIKTSPRTANAIGTKIKFSIWLY